MPRRDFSSRPSCWNPGNDKGLGFMEQTVALLDDHQDTRDFNVVRQSPNLHDRSGGPQQRKKLRTNHNCLHDSERIIGICAAVKPGALLPRCAPNVWTIPLIPAVTALVVSEQCDVIHACLANSARMLIRSTIYDIITVKYINGKISTIGVNKLTAIFSFQTKV
jgi:hypothetical protein